MPGLGALWDSLVDCICRPPRDEYIYPDELVGGSRRLFRVGRYPGIREDLTLTNRRGLLLQCSHYLPKHVQGKDGRLPCVLYCHCNSGSRRDAEEAICVLIPCGISVFTLDFAGSGLSEGQWVTLGAEEVDDVATAVEHLRSGGRVSTLGLWGRSMGAVTALLYSQRDPSIAGMVLDSPFARLTDLMLEIVQEQRLPIPRPLAKLALAAMKRSVQKRAGFDITKVSPVDAAPQSFIPALFGHATEDTFIRISHAEALHEAYAGDKNLIRFEGDHNSRRPEFFYNSVSIFWHNTLQLEHLLEPAEANKSTAAAALSTSPLAVVAAAGPSNRRGAGRPLRPPPARLRQPQSVPALAAPADMAADSPKDGVPGAAPAAAGNGTAAADGGAGAGGGEEDEGVDVTGTAGRSAPWEPRLWELDPDGGAREKQRFRRMAGGLPSPGLHGRDGSVSAAADGPLGSGGGPSGGGGFRNSAELSQFFATASDESLTARLLGQDPQWLDRRAAAAVAAPPQPPPDARLMNSLMAAALLLPATEEEEEAQLQEALERSLLEAAAEADGDVPAAAAAAAAERMSTQLRQQRAAGQQQPAIAVAAGAGGVAAAGGEAPGGRADGAADGGAAATSSRVSGSSSSSAAAATAAPSLLYPGAITARPPSSPQMQLQRAGAAVTAAAAASTAAFPGWSPSHEDPRTQALIATRTSASLSGFTQLGQQPGGPGPDGALASLLAPAASAVERPSGKVVGGAAGGAIAAAAAGSVGMGKGVPSGGPAESASGCSGAVGRGAGTPGAAAAGRSLYDMYTEEELLAWAMQLSLQESAAVAPAASPPAALDGAAGAAGAGVTAAHVLPNLL